MKRLGVNIDHVATLRNARGGFHPDPFLAAKQAMSNGADSITIHLREDRRHIKDIEGASLSQPHHSPVHHNPWNNLLYNRNALDFINNEDVRRSYSICSAPAEGLSIGVKLVEGGKMSSFLTQEVKEGDVLEIMPPAGNFVINQESRNSSR